MGYTTQGGVPSCTTTELTETQKQIESTLRSMTQLLLTKNKRYGNTMQQPRNIFVKESDGLTNDKALRKRLDEKLSRIANSETLRKNDTADLIGYLVLLCIEKGWTEFDDLID